MAGVRDRTGRSQGTCLLTIVQADRRGGFAYDLHTAARRRLGAASGVMPILVAVAYRFFEGEEGALHEASNNRAHDSGGEVVLMFEGGRRVFVSWVDEPIQYAIGMSEASHFTPEAALSEHDVSACVFWSDLLGKEVALNFVVSDNQVLEVSSDSARLLLCSFERGQWWADEVTVCKEIPAPYAN